MHSAKDLVAAMARDLGTLPTHLETIIRTAPLRYKVFFIEKKNGGLRQVAQPARELKEIQRWINRLLEPILPVHESATAYRRGSSIKENAQVHVQSNYMLKLDFKDFFPSIKRKDIESHLKSKCSDHLDSSAIRMISYLSTWAPLRQTPLRLCIGAPSSPLLSNTVMYDFDVALSQICADRAVKYTRYADDITLSSLKKHVLEEFVGIITNQLEELPYPRIALNAKKSVFASKAGRRIVAGVTITPTRSVSIGRDRKRLIRAMYHRYIKGLLSADETRKLFGLIAFAEHIEPGYAIRLARMSNRAAE